jgi:hypothetical protein
MATPKYPMLATVPPFIFHNTGAPDPKFHNKSPPRPDSASDPNAGTNVTTHRATARKIPLNQPERDGTFLVPCVLLACLWDKAFIMSKNYHMLLKEI